MKILVTGGCGFIGSNFIKLLLQETDAQVINFDNQTYAGVGKNIEHMKLDKSQNYKFIKGDICNKTLIKKH